MTASAERPGVEPAMTVEEFERIEAAVRRAPEFLAALRRRGIADVSAVDVDPVSAGSYDTPEEQGERRFARVLAYVRPSPGGNAYARPIEGVFGLVDVHSGELVHFEDRDPVPLPEGDGEFRAEHVTLRDDVRPIHISQPEGPSFTVDGHEVRWQGWSLRVGFSTREGLVLHEVAYDDHGETRRVLDRASYAEMVVPYAHPDRYYQTPLDIGEFNIGTMTNPLTLGCDCLGVIHYFDVAFCDADGAAGRRAERDLPPRGGRRDAVEAQRLPDRPRRAAARPAARPVEHRHRRQLRLRLLLVPAPGRDDRLRGQGHRHRRHAGDGRRRALALRQARRAEPQRDQPPARLLRPARRRAGRRAQRGARGADRGRSPRAPRTRTATRGSPSGARWRPSSRRGGSSIRSARARGSW